MKIGISHAQRAIVSEIMRDIAQVFFASVFVGQLIGGEINVFLTTTGFFLSIGFWYMSILLIKK